MHLGARYLLISLSGFALVNLTVKLLGHLPFEQLVVWRALFGLAISVTYLKWREIPVWGVNRRMLIFRGVAGTLALTLFFYTLHHMPLATAVTIQYLSPLFTVLVSRFFFGEQVSVWHWIFSLVGFAGVWTIQGFDPRVSMFDATLGVISAFCSALAYNSVRSLRHSDHEWVVVFYFPLITLIVLGPYAATQWVWPAINDWPYIVIIGVATQFAQLYLTKAYHTGKASELAAFNYVGVLYAILFGVFLFGETLPLSTLLGIALILGSVLASLLLGRLRRPVPESEPAPIE